MYEVSNNLESDKRYINFRIQDANNISVVVVLEVEKVNLIMFVWKSVTLWYLMFV